LNAFLVCVVSIGFALSAAGHALEWAFFDAGGGSPSSFTCTSLVSAQSCCRVLVAMAERFDPAGARTSYGRIAAAGTTGGIIGSHRGGAARDHGAPGCRA
jgi:hypothetical protein